MTAGFEEADPVRELHGHLDQTLRVAVAGALQVAYVRGERELQTKADRSRQLDRVDRELTRRRAADRAMAEALWRRANVTAWWEQASPEQIARTYEAAHAYAGVNPDAADALVRIDTELDQRYGLKLDRESGLAHSTTGEPLDQEAVTAAMGPAEHSAEQTDARLARWRDAVGAEVAEPMVTSAAWPALEQRLSQLDAQGIDSAKALADAARLRAMEGAKDVARVLSFRLSDPATKAKDKGLGVEVEGLDRARLVNDTLASGQAPAPGPAPGHGPARGHGEESEAAARRRAPRDRDPGRDR